MLLCLICHIYIKKNNNIVSSPDRSDRRRRQLCFVPNLSSSSRWPEGGGNVVFGSTSPWPLEAAKGPQVRLVKLGHDRHSEVLPMAVMFLDLL